MTIDEQKKELRKKIRELKTLVPFEEKKKRSEFIFNVVENSDSFINANTVMAYWSLEDEVQTRDFIEKWFDKKLFILPVVNGDVLILRKYSGISGMKTGQSFGILEPVGDEFTDFDSIDLIIVPGVAFDVNNNRMGRGKAYYDRLLKTTKAIKMGVCFDFQFFENVPHDEFDVKMDLVIKG